MSKEDTQAKLDAILGQMIGAPTDQGKLDEIEEEEGDQE